MAYRIYSIFYFFIWFFKKELALGFSFFFLTKTFPYANDYFYKFSLNDGEIYFQSVRKFSTWK